MLTHYFKITFRNLWKYKTQSLISIFGLAFALACFVPALFWLHYETSYDNFYPEAENIYRVYSIDKQTGKTNDLVSGILEKKLREQLPAMQNSTVFFTEQNDCSTEETPHIRLQTIFTDSTFFNVFPQIVADGSLQQSLLLINNIILTETVAIRLFGNIDKAIGKQIKSTSLSESYTVIAVVKDPPNNTNVPFDAILPHEQIKLQKSFTQSSLEQIWIFATLHMYVRLHPQTNKNTLAEQLRNFLLKSNAKGSIELQILPVYDVRHKLNNDASFTLNFIRLFVAAVILLLFSALFNFLNLHIDLFRQRIRELHLRSVHGSSVIQLIQLMMLELACSILLALFFAFCFVALVRPLFSELLSITIGISQLITLFFTCGIVVLTSMLLISFSPLWRLSMMAKRQISELKSTSQSMLRSIAVVLQLAVSIVFIVAALVVMLQMRFVNHKDLGIDCNEVIYLSGLNPYIDDNMRVALIKELKAIPQVEKITDAAFTPQHNVNPYQMITKVEWAGKLQSENPSFHLIFTDSRFVDVFKTNMLLGDWLNNVGIDKIVLNEEAVRVMGLSEPVGSIIQIKLNDEKKYKVIGVVKDIHTLSLRSRIHPTIFMTSVYPVNSLYIRAVSGQEHEAIKQINTILPKIDPVLLDVTPTLLNELYDRLNYSEQAGLKIFSVLATVCLFISLFGIYAVASAATQRRRKEIAVRKVVGAKVEDIIRMFFREYTTLVIIASAIALPLAFVAMSRWLQEYAYRTNIPWWLLTGVVILIIAVVLFTILGQILKAANSNPAEVVKSE